MTQETSNQGLIQVTARRTFDHEVTYSSDRSLSHQLGYVASHKSLSAQASSLKVKYQNRDVLEVFVQESVFNPIESISSMKLLDLLLSGELDVRDKSVADLGCGSGIIGLTAIHAGAAKVLFTDINPNVVVIANHPLLRNNDEVCVQSFLETTNSSSYDFVIALPPALEISEDQNIDDSSYESGIFRKPGYYASVIHDSARVLVPGGKLISWFRTESPPDQVVPSLLLAVQNSFHPEDLDIIACGTESEIIMKSKATWFEQFAYKIMYRNTKKQFWSIVSLTKR